MNQRSTSEGLRIAVALLAIGILPPASAQTTGDQGQPAPAAPASPPAEAAPPSPAAPAAAPAGPKVIFISGQMPYADSAIIDPAVRNECQLPTQGAELLENAATRAGLQVQRNDEAVKAGKGRTFQVEIVGVVSSGNAFIGHRKQVTVRGRLMEGGKEIAVFQGGRNSMGGAFGGFKGSCSVLERCLDALSKDMTVWLKAHAI